MSHRVLINFWCLVDETLFWLFLENNFRLDFDRFTRESLRFFKLNFYVKLKILEHSGRILEKLFVALCDRKKKKGALSGSR